MHSLGWLQHRNLEVGGGEGADLFVHPISEPWEQCVTPSENNVLVEVGLHLYTRKQERKLHFISLTPLHPSPISCMAVSESVMIVLSPTLWHVVDGVD